jgi:hypothetical protein
MGNEEKLREKINRKYYDTQFDYGMNKKYDFKNFKNPTSYPQSDHHEHFKTNFENEYTKDMFNRSAELARRKNIK